jgi:regulator of sirC expression with transglutaminase-like and TPR domain
LLPGLLGSVSSTLRALHVRDDAALLAQLLRRLLGLPEPLPQVRGPCVPAPEVDALLRGDDRGLDVALGASLLAWEDSGEVDVDAILDLFDELAYALKQKIREVGDDPAARLKTLNRFFFHELGFNAPTELSQGGDRLANLLFPFVLRRRRGHCVGLSTVYLALGYRVGLPLFGVSVPGHFFVRWDGEGLRQNVETTARGLAHDDAHYVERFRIAPGLVDRGVYLQSLRRREVLVEVLNNRANFYWDRGDVARASRDLDRVVQVSHNFPRAYVGRGFMALHRGDLDVARRELQRAIEIDPEFPRAHLLLGAVHLSEGRVDAAEACLRRALRVEEPGYALACTNLGRVHARRGQLDEALAMHEKAVNADPACHVAWNNMGVAHRAAGDRRRARWAFRKALALVPEFLPARENLLFLGREGEARLGLRERPAFHSVRRSYEARMRRSPDDDELRAAYVRFLKRGGDTARAMAAVDEVLRGPRAGDSEKLERLAEQLREDLAEEGDSSAG